MIIKLYDNEKIEYPLIKINDKGYKEFLEILKKYQEDDEYNFDDFIELIKDKDWYFETLNYDVEVFF